MEEKHSNCPTCKTIISKADLICPNCETVFDIPNQGNILKNIKNEAQSLNFFVNVIYLFGMLLFLGVGVGVYFGFKTAEYDLLKIVIILGALVGLLITALVFAFAEFLDLMIKVEKNSRTSSLILEKLLLKISNKEEE